MSFSPLTLNLFGGINLKYNQNLMNGFMFIMASLSNIILNRYHPKQSCTVIQTQGDTGCGGISKRNISNERKRTE